MIGGQHHRIIDAGLVEHVEEVAELAVELEQLEAHLLALGAIGVADIIGGGQADRDDVGIARVRPSFISWISPRASASIGAVEFGRGAERRCVAGSAREAAGANGLAAALDRDRRCDFASQNGGGSSGLRAVRHARAATAALALRDDRGRRRAPVSVTKPCRSQYQRWSTLWPPIMTAARSLPATATMRLRGRRCLHQLAKRRHPQMLGDTV